MQSYQDQRSSAAAPRKSKTKSVKFRDFPSDASVATVASEKPETRHCAQPTTKLQSCFPETSNKYPEGNIAGNPAAYVMRQRTGNHGTPLNETDACVRGSTSSHNSSSSGRSALKPSGAIKQSNSRSSGRHAIPVSRTIVNLETRPWPIAGPDDDRKKPWYFRMNRQQAEIRLKKYADGTFVVRPTKHGGERDHCFTLSIIFKGRVFHVAIRRRKDNKWALGPERPDEQTYSSVLRMIEYHQRVPIIIHADNQWFGSTCLLRWPLESAC